MKHQNLTALVGESWIWPLGKAFDLLKEKIIPYLKARKSEDIIIFPMESNILRAFKEVPFDSVQVVILGQDPYHDGSATGLAFDNSVAKKPSPSLRNILKEVAEDTGEKPTPKVLSYLEHLPTQGVLLLNTALTVEKGSPESHLELWQEFTQEVIKALNAKQKLVWVLWGAKAQKFSKNINPNHTIVAAAHPSPFSYHKFKGCKCFTEVNKHLVNPIKWD